MPPSACFCSEIVPFASKVRVLIVRHAAEINKTSNTGRLVSRALTNSVLVDHGAPEHTLDLTGLLGENPWVLAPGAAPLVQPPAVHTLVVIDSTWASARGMRWRVPPLASVPTLSLPAPVIAPIRRMRRGDHPDQMATIEAVAAALDFLGEPEPAAHLRRLFDVMAERVWRLRGFDMPPKRRGIFRGPSPVSDDPNE